MKILGQGPHEGPDELSLEASGEPTRHEPNNGYHIIPKQIVREYASRRGLVTPE